MPNPNKKRDHQSVRFLSQNDALLQKPIYNNYPDKTGSP